MACVFCEIIKGNIPSVKVYEDNNVLAILSIRPVTKGHTVIFHKNHKENLLDQEEEEAATVLKVIRNIAPAIMKGSNATAFAISMNNYRDAGQEIKHAHMHIIPRFKGDGLRNWKEGSYEKDEIKKYRDAIVKELKQ